MDPARFTRVDAMTWRIEPSGPMRVPAIIYADEDLIRGMDDKVYDQAANVAVLPGIVTASYVMPDAHWATAFRSAGLRPSMPTTAAWSRRAAWASTFRAACAPY